MSRKAVRLVHVPDVRATVEWYRSIGFRVTQTYDNDEGGPSFGVVSRGSSEVMFNEDGKPSSSFRREVDLYVYTDEIDALYGICTNSSFSSYCPTRTEQYHVAQ